MLDERHRTDSFRLHPRKAVWAEARDSDPATASTVYEPCRTWNAVASAERWKNSANLRETELLLSPVNCLRCRTETVLAFVRENFVSQGHEDC